MDTFKKYWSFLFDIVVERTSSNYNEELKVALRDGKYLLNSKSANYSFGSLHLVFQQVLKSGNSIIGNSDKVLILGFGVGSIYHIIHEEMKLNPTIHGVEIDEKVIELGKKYFGLNPSSLDLFIQDALTFVEKSKVKYDLVIVDLFKGIDVPHEFLEISFFEKLKTLLNEKGKVLLNFVAHNYEKKQQIPVIKRRMNTVFATHIITFECEQMNHVFYFEK